MLGPSDVVFIMARFTCNVLIMELNNSDLQCKLVVKDETFGLQRDNLISG